MDSYNSTGKVMKRKHPYVVLDVTPFRDKRLSWKARGLMVYFLDKPDGWKFYLKHIYTQAPDGKQSVASGLNELKKYGYLVRVAFRKNKRVDHYSFLVYEQPVAYPVQKDLHIDLEEWEKHLEEGGDIDITLFAENRKPAQTLDINQVTEKREPALGQPGKKPLLINKDSKSINKSEILNKQQQQEQKKPPEKNVVVKNYQNLINTVFKNSSIKEKTVETLIDLASQHEKDLTKCIRNAGLYLELSGEEAYTPIGLIKYEITQGWDLGSIKPKSIYPDIDSENTKEFVFYNWLEEKGPSN